MHLAAMEGEELVIEALLGMEANENAKDVRTTHHSLSSIIQTVFVIFT